MTFVAITAENYSISSVFSESAEGVRMKMVILRLKRQRFFGEEV